MTRRPPLTDVAVGVLLAVCGIILTSGAVADNTRHSGPLASIFVLLMTAPVIWRSRAPVAVAVVLGAGAVINPLVVGEMVRCGPSLPTLLLCAYSVGRRPKRLSRVRVAVAMAGLLLSATVQCFTDPRLNGPVMVALGPMILGLYGVGLLVESLSQLAGELERRNEHLCQQRRRRAELAVTADRGRIADGLDLTLYAQMNEIGAAATAGRLALGSEQSPVAAQEAFGVIQRRGRETLGHMRSLVGTLLEREATEPQPSLNQLDRLLERAGPNDIHLHVTGQPRVLAAGAELCAYRTLEHLLDAYRASSGSRVDVEVDFATDSVALRVSGPAPDPAGLRAALAGARARVDVHQGSLSSMCPDGRWEATAWLPV